MDNFIYLIIILGLTIFMLFFGGHNNQELIEYETNYYSGLNIIIAFEKKINLMTKNTNNEIFINQNFININKFLNTTNVLVPNFVNCFIIKIYPFKTFNIFNLINKTNSKTHWMVIFNHDETNNLELFIYSTNDKGYFYNLTKKISLVGIHHIYNNSNKNIIISCFILKKPFWFR